MCFKWAFEICLRKYCGRKCCRCLLITLNIPLSIIGMMVTGVFTYSKMLVGDMVKNTDAASVALRAIESVIILGIVVGLLVTLSGVLGCLGACCESRKGILAHLIFLVAVFTLEVAATVALFFIRGAIQSTVQEADLDALCKFCSQLLTEDSGALQIIAWALVAIIFVHAAMLVAASSYLCILKSAKNTRRGKSPITLTIVHGVPIPPEPIPLQSKLPESGTPIFESSYNESNSTALMTETQFNQLPISRAKQLPKSRVGDVTRDLRRKFRNGLPLTPLLQQDMQFTFLNEEEKGEFVNPSASPTSASSNRGSIYFCRSSTPTIFNSTSTSSASGSGKPRKPVPIKPSCPPSPPPPPPPSTPVAPADRPPSVALDEIKRALEARRLRFTY